MSSNEARSDLPRGGPRGVRFPLWTLLAIAVLSLVLIGALGWGLWSAHRYYVAASRVETRFREASAKLLSMSEILTDTLRRYVATGDRRWLERWEALEEAEHRTVKVLMGQARSLGLEMQIGSFEATHERLEDLQKEIIGPLGEVPGAWANAARLMASTRYETSVRLYASAVDNLVEHVNAIGRHTAERAAQRFRTRMLAGAVILLGLSVAWVAALVFTARQRDRRLAAERALVEALAAQEHTVEERTRELHRANQVLREEVGARARAERDLRERGAALAAEMTRLNAVLESMDQGLTFFDADARLVLCNPPFLEMNCMAPGDVEEGMTVEALEQVSGCCAPVLPHAALERVRAVGATACCDEPLREEQANRAGRIFELRSTALAGGGCVTIYTDLTERVAAERRFREVVDKVPCGVLAVDDQGCIRLANAQAEALFGYPLEELIGTPVDRLVPEHVRECHARRRAGYVAQAGAGVTRREVAGRRADGSEFPFELGLSRVELPEGRMTLCVVMDVSERAALQAQLLQAQKLESIGQLAAGIAHEINTPTQYIGDNLCFLEEAFGDIRTLQRVCARLHDAARAGALLGAEVEALDRALEEADWDYLAEEIPSAIEQAEDGVHKVAKIVRAMKEFSHPGGEGKEVVDLNRVVENTVTVARNEWKYVADLELELDESLPAVACLPGEIGQVVLNLVVNAAHAIGDVVARAPGSKGRLRVSTGHDEHRVEIRVADSGGGIPAAVRDKVFNPFFTTKEVGRGSGQGLAIARNVVVAKHGGSIDFETREGEGTTFRVRLPIAEAGASEHEEAA